LHILRENNKGYSRRVFSGRVVPEVSGDSTVDFERFTRQYQGQLTAENLHKLSTSLGVSEQSLRRLRIGWDGEAYTFPMLNAHGQTIGIRRRFANGRKVSVTGSTTGLFVPTGLDGTGPLLVCEGTTDTAAALDLGFDAIGRPNCNSRIEMTARAAKGRTEIVIVGDADVAGQAGAQKLADALTLHYPCVKIIYPPDAVKDLRAWLQAGLDGQTLQQIIAETKPIGLSIHFAD
jgi:hypothetical protein